LIRCLIFRYERTPLWQHPSLFSIFFGLRYDVSTFRGERLKSEAIVATICFIFELRSDVSLLWGKLESTAVSLALCKSLEASEFSKFRGKRTVVLRRCKVPTKIFLIWIIRVDEPLLLQDCTTLYLDICKFHQTSIRCIFISRCVYNSGAMPTVI